MSTNAAECEEFNAYEPLTFEMRERYARTARTSYSPKRRALASAIVAQIDRHNSALADIVGARREETGEALQRKICATATMSDALKKIIAALNDLEGATDGRR